MFKRLILLIIAGVMTMAIAGQAQAQGSPDSVWQASYWNNRYLSGSPVLQREENSINHNWGTESPHWRIDDNTFSARWVGFFNFRPATYRFTAVSDDGVRVWVDGDLIIDAWYDHPLETFTADKNLSAGYHQVVVEYYENQSGATIRFWWAPAPPPDGNNWRGEYYNNTGFGGRPDLVREDPVIGFNWNELSPGPGIDPDTFSVRWTKTENFPAGNYRFTMTVDDGGRLWVNGRRLIDAWRTQSPTTYTGEIYLPGGPTPLRMEYFENRLGAMAHLFWERIPDGRTDGWRVEYYEGTSLSGAPVAVQNVPEINFNWGQGSPAPYQVGLDHFSARWTRTLYLEPGSYRFDMTVDDGGRLWVDDQLLIDGWRVQSAQTYSGEIYLPNQPVQVRLEYFENTGDAMAQLSWTQTSPLTEAPPPPVWQPPAPAPSQAFMEECLAYLRSIGRPVDPNTNPNVLIQECQQFFDDAG